MKIKIDKQLKCERCGYRWNPKKTEIRMCPRCKSAWWDVKKVALFLLFFVASPAHANAVPTSDAVRAIVGEASGQGLDGMIAVGEVIRNRGSVKGLYGFQAMNHRNEPTSTWKMAARAWEDSAKTDITHGATLFENIYKFGFPRSWDRMKVICVAQISDHWFFKEI